MLNTGDSMHQGYKTDIGLKVDRQIKTFPLIKRC